jgi:hypothetical protein
MDHRELRRLRLKEIEAYRLPADGQYDGEQSTEAAKAVFIVIERAQQPARKEDPEATASAELRYKEVQVRLPGRYTPQLLDAAVNVGGTVGLAAGPLLTAKWASLPPAALVAVCAVETIGVLAGMTINRFRRRTT